MSTARVEVVVGELRWHWLVMGSADPHIAQPQSSHGAPLLQTEPNTRRTSPSQGQAASMHLAEAGLIRFDVHRLIVWSLTKTPRVSDYRSPSSLLVGALRP